MKINRFIVRLLSLLGFGGVVMAVGGCVAQRSSRGRTPDSARDSLPAADSTVVRDVEAPVQVMYGVPPTRFDANRPVPRREQ